MKLDILPIGLYQENSYVLHDNDHILFIDPGRYANEIIKCVAINEIPDAIILTHGHSDHTGAVDDLAEQYHIPVYIHQNDTPLVDPSYAKTIDTGAPIYSKLSLVREGAMKIGHFNLTIIHTPGHSSGSILIQYRNCLFTGDTLFAGDIGRTDLYSGNDEEMTESLKKILSLPGDLIIYPGHGPSSTIIHEKQFNPYLVELIR